MLDQSLYSRLKRGPQVVLPKDAALVSGFTGLQGGDRVVDAGAGSGWLSIHLAGIVAPNGKVYSYEWREDFASLAEKNAEKAGFGGVIELIRKNIFEGIEQTEVDLVTLDLAGAEAALPHAFAALKQGGWCVGFLPNVEQFKTFVLAGEKAGFAHDKTVESIVREWLVREKGCRPATTGLTHTVFLSFLIKKG